MSREPPPAAPPALPSGDAPAPPAVSGSPAPSADPWASLRAATPARIGLGSVGDAPPLAAVLALQLGHARARDAVRAALDPDALAAALAPHPALVVRSAAPDRPTYLRRPDLGRRLDPACRDALRHAGGPWDVGFVLADGLSAAAVRDGGAALFRACRARLPLDWSVAPAVIATQARVALGDEVGQALGAVLVLVLIGERPGLSVPSSLGAYLTHDPRPGRRDSERNCVSNIHPRGGLTAEAAADEIAWLMREARARRLTGVALKDEAAPALEGGR